MKRLLALGLTIGLLGLVTAAPAADKTEKEKEKVMEGLRELNEFIGGWKGSAQKRPGKPLPGDPFYAEELDWSWRFKGNDVWLSLKTKSGKFLRSGELRYLPAKKQYVFESVTPEKKKWTFTGTFKDDKLTLERVDPDTKETQQLRFNTAAEGIRLIVVAQRKNAGATIWRPEVFVQTTRLGESLARTEKKNECVVSGGLGTTTVSFNGETFYVCCSGCAEAFRENPKKYVDEFKAKKKK
jgi:hypothetical protein